MDWFDRFLSYLGYQRKFTPADAGVNWTYIQTLVHGPGTPPWGDNHNAAGNSAVFACLMAIAMAYLEPPITVYTKRASSTRSGRKTPLPNHPLQALLDKPTPKGELSMRALWFWTAWAKHTDGNAYWKLMRSGNERTGNVVEMWPISPAMIEPVSVNGEWISYYKHQYEQGKYERIPVENIVHFRLGVDDKDMRKGLSPLKRLVRETAGDDEASKFTNALLKNYAIPGLVVIPGTDVTIDEDGAKRIKASMQQNFGNENRGAIAVLSQDSKVQQFGFSPKDLDMGVLHRIPEERISAVMGVPAIIAGLGAGLDRSTFANFREAREMFTERLIPIWSMDADTLNVSLKPNFTQDRNIFLEFDLTDVRGLQEDMDKVYARLNLGVAGGWILRNEARSEVGLDPIDGWDEEDMEPPAPPPVVVQPAVDEEDKPEEEEEASEDEKMRPFSTNGHRTNGATVLMDTKASTRQLVNDRRRIRARVARAAEKDIDAWFKGIAAAVMRRADVGKERKALSLADWQRIVTQIFRQEAPALEGIIANHSLDVIAGTWGSINTELGLAVQFRENDPLVLQVLETAGDNIRGITQTTLDELRAVLPGLYDEGLPPAQIAQRISGMITETYSGRSLAIARTEIGTAQNAATAGRYGEAGVKHVEVFDNGFDSSHPFCKQVNGKVVTLEWAERNPLQHPNCVRGFGAVFDYDGDVFTEEERWN